MELPFSKSISGKMISLPAALANRHGLIAGATGTGKTITLRVLAEKFSALGVPVFLADVKGDLSGMAQAGATSPKMVERLNKLALPEPQWSSVPVGSIPTGPKNTCTKFVLRFNIANYLTIV